MTYEHHVDKPTLPPNDEVLRVIAGHGIDIWFEPMSGYILPMCREFYQRLKVVDEDLLLLKMNVRLKAMEITPGLVADLLKYERHPPNTLVYRHNI